MQAANTLFNMTLHDRLGETHYVDARGREQTTSLWLRRVGGHTRSNDGSGQNKTRANRYVAQLGAISPSGAATGPIVSILASWPAMRISTATRVTTVMVTLRTAASTAIAPVFTVPGSGDNEEKNRRLCRYPDAVQLV